jgi:hypothetical protein
MKSVRISILGTPEFKAFLRSEAQKAGISVSELVRRRCGSPTEGDALLAAMADELRRAVDDARRSLHEGLQAVQEVLAEVRMRDKA